MTKPKKPTKWHAFDEAKTKAWNDAQRPNVVFFPEFNSGTSGPTAMPGMVSCLGSNFSSPVVSSNGLTVGGEMVLVRTEGTLTKAYQYMVATSTDGSLHCSGPYKDSPVHHVHPGQQVVPEDFFGHTPASKSKAP